MNHVVFLDSKQPTFDPGHMRSLLVESLKKGSLGNLKAVMDDNFTFRQVDPGIGREEASLLIIGRTQLQLLTIALKLLDNSPPKK